METGKIFYTITEVARMLGVVRLTIYNEIERGNLKAIKIGKGRNYRVAKEDFEQYVEKNTFVPQK